ncbi:MAG: endonuclease/exonuclease/phosphatase family protein [Planctomycetes bacterium]|nr:endonuclease/exonuclease/phosphatase family protein [Planctomycetota bacterium]
MGIDRRHSVERISDAIREYDPDIVAIQELEVNHRRSARIHQPSELADRLKMDYHYHPPRIRGEAGFGNAILTRLNMRHIRCGVLPSFPMLQKRGAIRMSVEIDGQEVQIINTHLGLMGRERLLQARALCGADWLDHQDCRRLPRIVCGDFNATPRSPAYRLLAGTLRDAQKLAGDPKVRTWPSVLPFVRYDHMFVGHGIHARKVEVPRTRLTTVASDHLPVLMEFELHPEGLQQA